MHSSGILRRALGVALTLLLTLLFGCVSTSPGPETMVARPAAAETAAPTIVAGTTAAPAQDEPSGPEGPTPTETQGYQLPPAETGGVRITILYDNYAHDPRLQTAWGFAALVEHDGRTLLFDTGGDGPTLLGNLAELNIDLQAIEAVVLSHSHGDHTAGLPDLLATGIRPVVYVPASFASSFKDSVRLQTELVEVSGPLEILPGLHTTGEIRSGIVEQALVVETEEGMVVITGCAHPGIVRMVARAREIVPGDTALVMGGFHLGDTGRGSIRGILADFREMGVRQVSPTHCTGDTAIEMFAEEYGESYIQAGAGQIIVVGPEP